MSHQIFVRVHVIPKITSHHPRELFLTISNIFRVQSMIHTNKKNTNKQRWSYVFIQDFLTLLVCWITLQLHDIMI